MIEALPRITVSALGCDFEVRPGNPGGNIQDLGRSQRKSRQISAEPAESTNSGNRWEIMARDPPGVVFQIPGNSITNYAITAKALEPGVYHVHTQLNVANVGPGLGPGTTVVVEGEPIIKPIPYAMLAYQSVMIAAAYIVTFATRPWQVI